MRLSTYVLSAPVVVAAAVVAVANRQSVVFSLDPFSQAMPAIAIRMPLFVLLFLTLVVGVLLGGFVAFLSRRSRPNPSPDVKSTSGHLPGSRSGANKPPR